VRPDGFAGYVPVERNEPAYVTTTPIVVRKRPVRVTADVETNGFVRVGVLDNHGNRLAQNRPLRHIATDATVESTDGFSFDRLGRQPVRLEFEFKNATVYSFSFEG